jgi:DNA-binding CsgD family transcriptional regulator
MGSGWSDTRGQLTYFGSLTLRERSILVLLAEGMTNQEIATDLKVSLQTVNTHVMHILHKTGFRSRKRLMAHVLRTL